MTNEPSTSGDHGSPDLEARLKRSIQAVWQEEVRDRLRTEHTSYASLSADEQFALFLEYVLHTDMRHYWIVPDQVEGHVPDRPWFVQIEHVEDISQPAKRRYVANCSSEGGGTNNSRLLKMMVFDGRQHHVAIEHVQLSFRTGWPKLGSKMLIDAGAISRDGVFLLTPGTCGVLGGVVEEFESRQRVVDEVLQEPVYGRRGPPLQLEAYMEGVKEKVCERIGGTRTDADASFQATFRAPQGDPMVNTAANASNKRGVVGQAEDPRDVAKRQRDIADGPEARAVQLQNQGAAANNTNGNQDVINLLSSDDEW